MASLPTPVDLPVRLSWPRTRVAIAGLACACLLAAGGAIRQRQLSFGAAWAATTEAMGRVRTVHYVGRQQIAGQWSPFDVKIELPDKRRWETPGEFTDIVSGDRDLHVMEQPSSAPWHPRPYRYVLSHVSEDQQRGLQSNDFTLESSLRSLPDHRRLMYRRMATDPSNRRAVEVRFESSPQLGTVYTTTVWVDPETHLLTAWHNECQWKTEDGRPMYWRSEIHFIEYNLDFPADTFSTEPPAGEEVLDQYSEDGMRAGLEHLLVQAEAETGERQRALVKEFNDNDALWQVSRLSPKAQNQIRERMAKLGVKTRAK
jgi:outer membrane lipoprotein-sorting protein